MYHITSCVSACILVVSIALTFCLCDSTAYNTRKPCNVHTPTPVSADSIHGLIPQVNEQLLAMWGSCNLMLAKAHMIRLPFGTFYNKYPKRIESCCCVIFLQNPNIAKNLTMCKFARACMRPRQVLAGRNGDCTQMLLQVSLPQQCSSPLLSNCRKREHDVPQIT